MLSQMAIFPSVLWLNNTTYYYTMVYNNTNVSLFLIHSSVDGHLDCFLVLAIVNTAVVNMNVQISLQSSDFNYFRYIPRNGSAGSYGSSIFNFWTNHHVISLVAASISFCPTMVKSSFLSPNPHRHLWSLLIFIIAFLISSWFWFAFPWWCVMLSTFSCVCWQTGTFWMYSLKKCLFKQIKSVIKSLTS